MGLDGRISQDTNPYFNMNGEIFIVIQGCNAENINFLY